MSFRGQKMKTLILNESESIEERRDGYRKKILEAIIEILQAERAHKGQRTNIQKQVDAACYAAGDYLARKPDIDNATTKDIQ